MPGDFFKDKRLRRSSLGGAELGGIDPGFAGDRGLGLMEAFDGFARKGLETGSPGVALDWNALSDWRALRQHTIERFVMPARREIPQTVPIEIAVDETGQRG